MITKTLSLVSLMVLAATIFSLSAKGDETPPPPPSSSRAEKLTPQIQAMLADLFKAANGAPAPQAPSTPSAPAAPAAPAASSNDLVASLMALLTTLPSSPSSDHGDQAQTQAQAAQLAKLLPQVQSFMAQLLKEANMDSEDGPSTHPASTTSNPSPVPAGKANDSTATGLHMSSLRTGGLSSGSVGGHGLDGGARMTNSEWRELFPVRK